MTVIYDRGSKSGGPITLELGGPRDEAHCARMFTEWLNDNRTSLYLSYTGSLTESAEIDWLQNTNGSQNEIVWMIYAGDTLVGNIGLRDIDASHSRAELGILLGDKAYWGRGLGQVVETTIVAYAFENIVAGGLHKIWACGLTGNEASKYALIKAGFTEIGLRRHHHFFQGRWFDNWQVEALRDEWLPKRDEILTNVGITELNLYPGTEDEGFTPVRG